MAWHILHGLLEQVRVQSTFPGKLWIIVMFIFRIVVVARIGDAVYEDEQDHFFCNTLTPGCKNVCYNRFSPISQLRYWSLMVLVVSTPAVLFFLYATHVIYHAGIKYPYEVEEEEKKKAMWLTNTDGRYVHPPSLKRRRDSMETPNPLFEVKKINADGIYRTSRLGKDKRNGDVRIRRHVRNNRDDETKGSTRKGSTDNNYESTESVYDYSRKYPIYVDSHGRKVEFFKDDTRKTADQEAIEERKLKRKMLQHPELFRAYWWHVVMRTILEVGFIVGQYYLYGWVVKELYNCSADPCPKTTECWVSRPWEKTCLMWLMYVLGFIACLLSLMEFCTMGFGGLKYAFVCCNRKETKDERRRRLALLEARSEKTHEEEKPIRRITSVVSLDSLSSDTTVESV